MTVVYITPLDFAGARVSGLKTLPFEKGLFEGSGSLESEVFPTDSPFDRLVGSWNAEVPPGAAVEMQAQARVGGQWTSWYRLSRWEPKAARSLGRQEDAYGFVDIDTLKLKSKADAFRYRMVLEGKRPGPRLSRVAISVTDSSKPVPASPPFNPGPWVREIPIRPRSQMAEQSKYRKDICSPTSLAMALEFWGRRRKTGEVAETVLDHAQDGVYGNWTLNVAAAATLGLAGEVAWLDSMEDLEREIAQGRPVVASITFAEGELTGAPIKRTRGHLLVVRGFTQEGDVIVNDPAAPQASSARRVYRRAEFEKVWLANKRGAAYLLLKRFPDELAVGVSAAELRLKPKAPAKPNDRDKDRVSELLSGERVRAVKASGDWVFVEALDQPKSRNGAGWGGYPGWVQAQALRAPVHSKPEPAKAPGGELRRSVLEAAARFIGQPYVWGGLSSPQSPRGIDCSGLTHMAYRAVGVVIPRDAHDQFLKARSVRRAELKAADLVFLSPGKDSQRINHVMLYLGGEGILESRDSAAGVSKTTFKERFGRTLDEIESGGIVSDLAKDRRLRRIHFGSFLP